MAPSKVSRDDLYHLAEFYPGMSAGEQGNLRAQWTGEKRPPRKGEWFLSGAIVEAYRSYNDLDTPYHIARIVRVKVEVVTTITETLED